MRQLHLDELPQVFNVARGEMLLLGPRPEAPQWVDPDDRRWDHVLEIPPGIAGPTQLIVDKWELSVIDEAPDGSAYVEIVVPVKQAIDSWYVDQASPRVDFLVLRSLLSSTLLRRTPRALRKAVRRDVLEAESPIRWDDAQPG